LKQINPDMGKLSTFLNVYGVVLSQVNNYEKALPILEEARPLFVNIKTPCVRDELMFNNNVAIGNSYIAMGKIIIWLFSTGQHPWTPTWQAKRKKNIFGPVLPSRTKPLANMKKPLITGKNTKKRTQIIMHSPSAIL
jgi:hypothetical protein